MSVTDAEIKRNGGEDGTAESRSKATGKGSRGPHSERSGAMRERLLEATVRVLARASFSGTTTEAVICEAGVSRGALLHHFPTRVDLILATVTHIVEWQLNASRDAVKTSVPHERLLAFVDTAWSVQNSTHARALLTIFVATQSDDALASQLPPIARQMLDYQFERIWTTASNAGVKDREAMRTIADLFRATARGLLVLQAVDHDLQRDVDAAHEMFRVLIRAVLVDTIYRGRRGRPKRSILEKLEAITQERLQQINAEIEMEV